MDEIIAFSVLFNDKARASTLSYTKAYEIHLGMFQRSLRQIIYTELHRQYMAAEEFAAQTQARNLILAFQRGLRHIAQWDENQMQRFVHGVSVGSAGNHLFRMPGDLLQTLSNLVHMLMFTNTDVIDLVENRLTHCPGFAINTETTIGEFVVKCMKEAALHFDSTPFLFSRAEKPQHWIENRQKIMQQIDAVVSMVVHEMATNIVTSVCQKLMYQVREPKTVQSLATAGAAEHKPAYGTAPATRDDKDHTMFQADAKALRQQVNNRNADHYSAQKNARPTAFSAAHAANMQQQSYRQQPAPVSGQNNSVNFNNHSASRMPVPYSSSSTEQHRSGPAEKTLYTDRRLLSGHATDQDYLEHAYLHGALRHTSTPVQPSKMQGNLTSSSTTAVDIVIDQATQYNDDSLRLKANVPRDSSAHTNSIAAPAAASTTTAVPDNGPNHAENGSAFPLRAFSHAQTSLAATRDDDPSRPISQSASQTHEPYVSPSASTVAAAIKTQSADAEAQRSDGDKTYSSNNLQAPTTVVTLVVDESGETATDKEAAIAVSTEPIVPTEYAKEEPMQGQLTETEVQRRADTTNEQVQPVAASLQHVVLENSESRPKPNEAQPLPLMHEQEDTQESDDSLST